MLDDSTLKKLEAFALSMRENARGGAGGTRRSRLLGSSVEFSDFRSYAPGDDLRRVDWNAFARFDRLFLKLFLDEQETTLRILLDASASMQSGEPDKWDKALHVAAALAYLSLCRYDRVTIAALSGDTIRASRVFAGRAAFVEVENHLLSIEPGGGTDLNAALQKTPLGTGRSVCVLISDLLSESGYERGASSILFRRQELSVLHMLSPEELSPDFAGALKLLDSEGEPPVDVQITPETQKRYHEALGAFLHGASSFCLSRGIPYLLLRSDMSLEADILRALLSAGVITAR